MLNHPKPNQTTQSHKPHENLPGKRSAGNPHAAFDVAGAGNVMMVAGLRPMTKVMVKPPEPKVRAPVLDPTCERLRGKLPRATRPEQSIKVSIP
jgi:hypothetical protein